MNREPDEGGPPQMYLQIELDLELDAEQAKEVRSIEEAHSDCDWVIRQQVMTKWLRRRASLPDAFDVQGVKVVEY